MKSVLYMLAILWSGVCVWIGMAIAVANRPIPLVKVIHAAPATYKPESCSEVYRVCVAKRRSAQIGPK